MAKKNFLEEAAEALEDLLSGKIFEGPEDVVKTVTKETSADEDTPAKPAKRTREQIFKPGNKPKPKPDTSSDSEEKGEAPGKQESAEGGNESDSGDTAGSDTAT